MTADTSIAAFPERPLRTAGEALRSVFLITGMSGAGKTSALKALEDLNFEAIDHVPLALLNRLVAPGEAASEADGRPIAIGVDVRTRDFDVDTVLGGIDRLIEDPRVAVRLVFMDCDDEVLRRRYSETRHRHPLATDRPVADGIALERKLLAPLRKRAHVIVDTTGLAPGQLKRIFEGHYGSAEQPSLLLCVSSFGFRNGLPREADLVFDVRFLANPHYDPDLRHLTGKDERVQKFILEDNALEPFFDNLTALLDPLLPRYAAEGKSYLGIAIGCTGGRHRSVYIAERLASWLGDHGQRVQVHHRDLDRPEP
jgi:UPF0042 nucleotide-binding protein